MPLPEPPPAGRPMLPPGTFDGTTVVVTGGGTGLGKAIAVELARAGAAVGILSRSEDHRLAGVAAVEAVGGRAADAGGRHPRARAGGAAFDRLEAQLGPVRVLVNNAAANFPVLAADMQPNGWRAVTQIVLDGTFFCCQELHRRCTAAGEPGRDLQHPGHPVVHRRARHGPHRGGQGRRRQPDQDPGRGVGARRHPGQRAGPRPVPPRGHARRPARRCGPTGEDVDARRSPAGRLGRLHELGWAVTWLCSPYAAFVTGHTLVVDGANWLRRDFVMPEFTPVADQLSAVLRRP